MYNLQKNSLIMTILFTAVIITTMTVMTQQVYGNFEIGGEIGKLGNSVKDSGNAVGDAVSNPGETLNNAVNPSPSVDTRPCDAKETIDAMFGGGKPNCKVGDFSASGGPKVSCKDCERVGKDIKNTGSKAVEDTKAATNKAVEDTKAEAHRAVEQVTGLTKFNVKIPFPLPIPTPKPILGSVHLNGDILKIQDTDFKVTIAGLEPKSIDIDGFTIKQKYEATLEDLLRELFPELGYHTDIEKGKQMISDIFGVQIGPVAKFKMDVSVKLPIPQSVSDITQIENLDPRPSVVLYGCYNKISNNLPDSDDLKGIKQVAENRTKAINQEDECRELYPDSNLDFTSSGDGVEEVSETTNDDWSDSTTTDSTSSVDSVSETTDDDWSDSANSGNSVSETLDDDWSDSANSGNSVSETLDDWSDSTTTDSTSSDDWS